MFKYWIISLGWFFGLFLGMSFVVTVLNYFNLLDSGSVSIFKYMIPLISIAVAGFTMGRHSKEKGYLSGIKIGVSVIFIFVIVILLVDKLSFKSLLYYVILLLTSILSSMIGINLTKK